MKKQSWITVALTIAALTLSAVLSFAAGGGLAHGDKKFVTHAAEGGLAEVQMGQLAAQNAQSQDVKDFGQRMVTDHGKANDELKALAQQKGVALPTELTGKHKKEADKLGKTTGANFDRRYMEMMVKDHVKDVADFRKASQNAKDADLKAWAGKTLPTLEDHLKQAREIAQKLGIKAK